MICPPPLRSVSLDSQAKLKLDGVRVPFVANGGQTDLAVAFYAQTLGGATFVTHKGEIVHALLARRRGGKPSGWSLTESMVGGRATPRGQEPADTRVSYFVGCERERWGSDLTAYRTVGLGEVWPGVSVSLRASGGSVEKLFTVKPGASDSTIRVRLGGAQSLSVDETGALAAGTGVGKFTFSAPIAYQEKGRGRIPVPVSYRTFGRDYGFRLGRHDPNLPVVIDPLLQSTYLAYETRAYAIGIHPVSGEVYVAGVTRSINFPGVAGGAQPTHSSGASAEAFVARLNPGLTAFLQSTYLGGIGDDWIFALAIHPITGDVYAAGFTGSPDFPATAGGALPSKPSGGFTSFIARLNSGLTRLYQATYFGGQGGGETVYGLAVDPASGDVYAVGDTTSLDLPGAAGGAQPTHAGQSSGDGFVARFNAGLTTLRQSSYLGGTRGDAALASAISPGSGDVYVIGFSDSSDFPATAGGAQPSTSGSYDTFLVRLNAGLTAFKQSTYLGGESMDLGRAIAIQPGSGDVYVTGDTVSSDFPKTAGGVQPSLKSRDIFVARLNSGLTEIIQATYLGGNDATVPHALAFHPTSGDLYVAGLTAATDLPGTAGGIQPAPGGGRLDGFVARLSASLTSLKQATYLGGSDYDIGEALAIHPLTGDLYVTGETGSRDFPATLGGAQPVFQGALEDSFIARMTADLTFGIPPTVTPTSTPTPPLSTPTSTPSPAVPIAIPVLSPAMAGVLLLAVALVALTFLRKT